MSEKVTPDSVNQTDGKTEILLNAINDLSGNIRFIDTKVVLIMTALGVITGALISCREDFYYVYQNWIPCQLFFVVLLFLYGISTVLTFYFSLMCILPRNVSIPDLKQKSIWYLNFNKENIKFGDYLKSVRASNDYIELLAQESFKLNKINSKKHAFVKLAVMCFLVSCALVFLFAIIPCYYYLALGWGCQLG